MFPIRLAFTSPLLIYVLARVGYSFIGFGEEFGSLDIQHWGNIVNARGLGSRHDIANSSSSSPKYIFMINR